MATINLEVITVERTVYSGSVDMVVAPGIDGELGILPHHTLLMTMLKPGELRIKIGSQEESLAVSGGFIQVLPDRVVVLADAAERVEEIDLARAEAARKRAQEKIKEGVKGISLAQEDAALRRALARITVAERYMKRGGNNRPAPKP
jgi:F-type H+-transporting ATPase subunit epsilon